MKNFETLDYIMFALIFVFALIGTFGIKYFHKTYGDEEKDDVFRNMAQDDEVGFTLLSYAFAWMIAVFCWGALLIILTLFIIS